MYRSKERENTHHNRAKKSVQGLHLLNNG
jgi:hypothetical protein